MAKSQNDFIKKEKEKKRLQKRKAKQERKEERKANTQSGSSDLQTMMAYVDEDGNIVDTPPELQKKSKIDASEIEIGIPKKEKEDPNALRRGRVSYFDGSKGYGFIEQDGSKERFFIHSSNLTQAIAEGDKVLFSPQKGLKGMEATKVQIIR